MACEKKSGCQNRKECKGNCGKNCKTNSTQKPKNTQENNEEKKTDKPRNKNVDMKVEIWSVWDTDDSDDDVEYKIDLNTGRVLNIIPKLNVQYILIRKIVMKLSNVFQNFVMKNVKKISMMKQMKSCLIKKKLLIIW